jgi:hypothetical protein
MGCIKKYPFIFIGPDGRRRGQLGFYHAKFNIAMHSILLFKSVCWLINGCALIYIMRLVLNSSAASLSCAKGEKYNGLLFGYGG